MKILWLGVFMLLSCGVAGAESEEIPSQMRGFWVYKKATCDILRRRGPEFLGQELWLKITATEVLGSTQGRFFGQQSVQDSFVPLAQLAVRIQMFDGLMEDLTLTRDGYLDEHIVDRRASLRYSRC